MKSGGKIIVAFTMIIMLFGINSYAHSGKTDSSGGHKDNKNVSGLGSYHYHCGGHPAHLHTNGICPYSSTYTNKSSSSSTSNSSNKMSTSTSKSSSTTSTQSSSTKTTSSVPQATPTISAKTAESIEENNIKTTEKPTVTPSANIATPKATPTSIVNQSSDSNTNNSDGASIIGGILGLGILGGGGLLGYKKYVK